MTITAGVGLDGVVVRVTVTFTGFSAKPGASSLGLLQAMPLHTQPKPTGRKRDSPRDTLLWASSPDSAGLAT